jgi:flagellar hook-basal body complex protein FliE
MVDRLASAVAAYANTAQRALAPGAGMEARSPLPGQSFAELVNGMVEDTIASNRTAEQVSADALVGRADINDVVMAVGNAEMGLQMVTGVRDRIIEAYQEIMRMPI